MKKDVQFLLAIAICIFFGRNTLAQSMLLNGIYVDSCSNGHTMEWESSNGMDGMGQHVISITEKFINENGILDIKEFNNQALENLDFDYNGEGLGKIFFKKNKIKFIEITSKISFISDDGCKWNLQK